MPRHFIFILAMAGLIATLIGIQPASGAVSPDTFAGKVVRLQGSAIAVQDANPRTLKAGDSIHVGDVLSTGENARLEIRMIDDGLFTLSERTVFVVIDYTFNGGGSAATRLMSGALQAVSGKLAKLDTRPFRVETEVATIGIRGTTFWVGKMPDGKLHVGLWSEGRVVVENKAGRSEITQRGDGVSIVSIDSPPSEPHPWPKNMNDKSKTAIMFDK